VRPGSYYKGVCHDCSSGVAAYMGCDRRKSSAPSHLLSQGAELSFGHFDFLLPKCHEDGGIKTRVILRGGLLFWVIKDSQRRPKRETCDPGAMTHYAPTLFAFCTTR
jgi:hypothetical protein